MDKILITGFSGFVGHHFLDFLYHNNIEIDVCGIDINEPNYDYLLYNDRIHIEFKKVNLLNIQEVKEVFNTFSPNYVLHLASFSSVAFSWRNPVDSFQNNTNIFLNLVSVVKDYNIDCRILSIGSSEEYGNVTKEDLPLKERQPLKPLSPYAVARVSQEQLSKVFAESYGLNIVLTRSFNHIGPWQDERFVVPSFIKRIKKIKDSGKKSGIIETGDVSIIRDFVDVRDVVRAYYLLLKQGDSGEIYNICSGKGVSLGDIICNVAEIMNIEVKTRINQDYIRPNDNKVIVGANYKIFDAIGWEPTISLDKTLIDMIEAR